MEEKGLMDKYPQVVNSIEDADVIIQKLKTPSSPSPGGSFLERLIPQGRLDFEAKDKH